MNIDSNEQTKVCSKCHKLLGISNFYKETRYRPNGTRSECKNCTKKKVAECYNTEHGRSVKKQYNKSLKRQEQIKRYMATERGRANAKKSNNSLAQRIAHKRYRQSDKGKAVMARKNSKRYAEIIIIATLTAQEWNDIKKQYKYRCVYCGEKTPLTMDHIIPVSKGGHHVR